MGKLTFKLVLLQATRSTHAISLQLLTNSVRNGIPWQHMLLRRLQHLLTGRMMANQSKTPENNFTFFTVSVTFSTASSRPTRLQAALALLRAQLIVGFSRSQWMVSAPNFPC